MAIANTFTFGGISTATYSVIVEGAGDYSGAKRAVEMISIPGRSGAFALDKGYFENEPAEYKVLIQGATQATFETAVAAFRNAILSKTGYQRLTDTYHPNEYRMAVYVGGFDEEPTFHGKGASFKVKFDCMPQRFLTTGETKQTIAASGDTLTNPTLFEASPMLEVEGYGTITVNGYEIELTNETFGRVALAENQELPIDLQSGYYSAGDTITLVSIVQFVAKIKDAGNNTVTNIYGLDGFDSVMQSGNIFTAIANSVACGFTYTAGTTSTQTKYLYFNVEVDESGTPHRAKVQVQIQCKYNASTEQITLNFSVGLVPLAGETAPTSMPLSERGCSGKAGSVYVDSTATILGHPTYVDCDLGAAYKISSNEIVSLNSHIDLGSELPTLASGSNAITFDNTITSLKVVPRWWKI